MVWTLYGFDASTVTQDAAGNTAAGVSLSVHTTYAGSSPFTATKAVNPTTLLPAADTAGVVTSDSLGRLGFFAEDYTGVLYLRQGSNSWPVNPTDQGATASAGLALKIDKAALVDGSGIVLAAKVPDSLKTRTGSKPVGQDEQLYSVKDYGAVGNGTTDDTTAIQAAITAAQGVGTLLRGGKVFFPPGRYRITATLNITNSAVEFFGSGWSSTATGQTGTGSLIFWDGGNLPMIKVQASRGVYFHDFMLLGNTDPAKKPTAGIAMVVTSGDTFKNGMTRFDRVSFGKLTGVGPGTIYQIVMDNGILWDSSSVDVQNDTSWVTACRFDGCAQGVQTTGIQSVHIHIQDSYFWTNSTAIKTVSNMRLQNIYCANSTVRDVDIASGARVEAFDITSEFAAQFAKLVGSGSSLVVRGGYWQLSAETQADRRVIDNNDDARTVVRLHNFQFTNHAGFALTLPILRVQPLTNSVNAQKILELDNVRFFVAAPNHGFTESMLEVTPPAGTNSRVTVFGNVQPAVAGSSSSNEGVQKFFWNQLKGGQSPNFNRDDRVRAFLKTGDYKAVIGGTGTTRALTTGSEFCMPIEVTPGQIVDRVAVNVSTAFAGTLSFAYRQDDINGKPSSVAVPIGTDTSGTTGVKEITGLSIVATGYTIWLSIEGPTGMVLSGINGPVRGVVLAATGMTTTVHACFFQTGVTAGVFPATAPTASGASSAPLVAVRAG